MLNLDPVDPPNPVLRQVAHDLRNAINPIGLHLELIRLATARNDADEIERHVAAIERSLVRGVQAIDRLCPVPVAHRS